MKILLLCLKFPCPAKDGYGHAVMAMVRSMHAAGCELTVLSLNTSKHYVNLAVMTAEDRQLADWHAVDFDNEPSKLDAVRNALFSKLPHSVVRFDSPAFRQKLTELLQHKQFDVVQLSCLHILDNRRDRSIEQAKPGDEPSRA